MAEASDVSRHPLIERLVSAFGIPEVGVAGIDDFLAGDGDALLFFTEDPLKYPESSDVAVILPELMRALPGRFRAAVVCRADERALQKRFGFARWPALVLVRNGDTVGTITGIHDWDDFVDKLRALLDAPTRREVAAAAVRDNTRSAAQEQP